MKKQTISLNETQLNGIIKKCIKEAMNETNNAEVIKRQTEEEIKICLGKIASQVFRLYNKINNTYNEYEISPNNYGWYYDCLDDIVAILLKYDFK